MDDSHALADLDAKLRLILPEEYQDCYENVQPTPMGSASLRFGPDGKVAWNELWATFCDLAMAGGPPHKGTLLQPATREALDAQPERHAVVVGEICRGIGMVTDLLAYPSPVPGWVRVSCDNAGMAGWLVRAIVMENVAAHMDGDALDVPAAPAYRLEKEIKNVVTVMAKTCHYWSGHIPRSQQRAISSLFAALAEESPLLQPEWSCADLAADEEHRRLMTDALRENALHPIASLHYPGWIGIECATMRSAIWMMRALVLQDLVARREGTVLFVPLNRSHDARGERVVSVLMQVRRLARARGIV